MYDRILVPTDGSEAASTAASVAVSLASRHDASLVAISVLEHGDLPPGVSDDGERELTRSGEQALTEIVDLAAEAGVSSTTEVIEASRPIHEEIIEYATDHDVDCIVMGTHGRSGLRRIVLGSVAERTLRTAPIPVITVHETVDFDPDLESVLVPTDGSAGAAAAADHAIGLAGAAEAALHIVHVVDSSSLHGAVDVASVFEALEEAGQQAVDEIVERAEAADLRSIEASVLAGIPSSAIVEYADERDVDCIVMGTHGRTGLDRYLLGSVTERVVRLADVPVISVKAQEMVAELKSEPPDGA